ncbi:MAG TPA: S8 family serine peptidase, partial [Candidatus Saccharimonadales bacterium]|nr:S8 family serine peptidase [Candidatus Saccharimonadales bacterium]
MHRITLALLLVALGAHPASARAAADPHARYAPPAPRGASVVTPAASARLQAEGTSALWVYFTDKGETDARSFASAVDRAGSRVGAAARARRARETGGRFVPDWYDVPVVPRYVDGVRSTGATVRQVSRWMNAVSVMADQATAARLSALPYVQSVTPVGRAQRVEPVGPMRPVPVEEAPPTPFERGPVEGAAPGARGNLARLSLDPPGSYGPSTNQMTTINARAAQDSGYTGAGVVVAMFDTGYDKNHDATILLKRIAEYDFVFHDTETANQAGDVTSQWSHGTGTWSVLGGYKPGQQIGPAYNASFLLAKTEDNRSETPVEEDNWLAAVEWADSLGCDVISSSLGYFTFDNPAFNHTYAQEDGKTVPVTKAAALAARRGIVVANAMSNAGPAIGSIAPPADADSILSVGAVDNANTIASFSGRGPTADGRGKPEVVAQGVFTNWAIAGSVNQYAGVNGTSLSTPLIGGIAAQVREAHPEWTVQQIRYALKVSGDKAAMPDSNTFGWGRPNVVTAIYGTPLGPPVFPKPFNLHFPTNASTTTSSNFNFRWGRTPDPNGDPVTYRLRILVPPADNVLYDATTTDTMMVSPGYLLSPGVTYKWLVSASDPTGHERESRDRYTFVTGSTTGVEVTPPASGVVLYPARPNPVQGVTHIPFAIGPTPGAASAGVTLRIFDASGRLIRTLLDNEPAALPAVRYQRWDGMDQNGHRVASGIYYYRLTVSG